MLFREKGFRAKSPEHLALEVLASAEARSWVSQTSMHYWGVRGGAEHCRTIRIVSIERIVTLGFLIKVSGELRESH